MVAVGHQIILRRLIQIKTVTERLTPSNKEGDRARKARAGNESGIDCGALSYGSHQLEREQTYYNHGFALTSGLVTNKGLIKMSGKNINFVQILQSN